MGMITAYLLFALTTAICAFYELIYPVILSLDNKSKTSIVSTQPVTTYVVLFVLSFVFAPVLLLPCLIPGMGDTFRDVLEVSLGEE